tara:strand:- start:96 stop:230 length:135 start_codon:yes stop_codon:yes gene_type:complete
MSKTKIGVIGCGGRGNLTNHNSSDIILFFKKDNIDIEKDKLVIY